MGICESAKSTKSSKPKNQNVHPIAKASKPTFTTVTNPAISIAETADHTKMNLSPKDDYIIPSKYCRHEKVSNYYTLSSNKLGEGVSGTVCLGTSKLNNRKYAIKTINKTSHVLKHPQELINEAEFNTKISHPNIIKCYEIFEDQQSVSFVMELGEGGDLFDFIVQNEEGHLPLNVVIDVFYNIMETVAYLHNEMHIVHRDLKPENFIVSINGNNEPIVKLIDFGLSTYIPSDKNNLLTDYVGTPAYAAPEIINRDCYDEKVDIWSLGVILFNMMTGCEPFAGNTRSELEDEIKYKNIDFDVIEEKYMRNLCKKLLERNTKLRYNSLEAFSAISIIKKIKDKIIMEHKEIDIQDDNNTIFNEIYLVMNNIDTQKNNLIIM